MISCRQTLSIFAINSNVFDNMRMLRIGLIMVAFWLLNSDKGVCQDFEVAPVVLNYALEPGQSETRIISILNHGDKPQSFVASISDPSNADLNNERSCAGWLSANPSFFEINPNQTQTIEVMMQVPSDGLNSRWAVIHVKAAQERTTLDADKVVATGITISPRVAIHVYQSAKSNTRYKAKLSKMQEITQPGDSIRTFNISIDNVGDKKLDCKVYMLASNLETVKEHKTMPIRASLYPDKSKTVILALPRGLEKGTYSIAAILDYGHRTDLEAIQMEIKVD